MQRLVELGADIAVIEKSATDFVTKTSGTRTCKGCGKKLRAGKACGKCAAKVWGRKAVELVIGHTEPAVALTIKSSRTVHPYYRSGRLVRGYTQQGPSRMQFAQGGLFGGDGEESTPKVTAEISYNDVPYNSGFPDANGYMVTLRYRGRKMKTPYYMGPAIGREPTAHDVMTSLALDAASYDNARGDFEEWAREYGYDLDDPDQRRKTKRTFRAVEREAKKLREFLGDDYDDFLRRDEDEMKEVTAGSSGASKSVDRAKVRRVMHEYKHGELHSGSKTGPKVKRRKQALAIALSEASKSQMVVVGDGISGGTAGIATSR